MGSVMADRHDEHSFFPQSPLASHLYTATADNNNKNTDTMSIPTSPSTSPSILSFSPGYQGQHHNSQYHSNSHQNQDQYQHNPHNHVQPLNPSPSDDCNSGVTPATPDTPDTPAFPADLRCSSDGGDKDAGNEGGSFPPMIYVAHALANMLLPEGAKMFGRRSDADCILLVGAASYYVHFPMLFSRSPTFRRIYTEMDRNGMWEPESNYMSDDSSSHHNYDQQADLLPAAEGGDWSNDASTATSAATSTMLMSTTPTATSSSSLLSILTAQATSKVLATAMDADMSMDEELDDCGGHEDGDDEDEDESEEEDEEDGEVEEQQVAVEEKDLPLLTIPIVDPEGSRFDELLYWIYTNNSERWLTHFTPQNYESILKNIVYLNMITPEVLAICHAFEQSPANEYGQVPRGTADEHFMLLE